MMEHARELVLQSLAAPGSSASGASSPPRHSAYFIQLPSTTEARTVDLAHVSDLKLAIETLNRHDLIATLQDLTDRQLKDFIFEGASLVPFDQHSTRLRNKMMEKMKRPHAAKTFRIRAFTDRCIEKLATWSDVPLDRDAMECFANVWFIHNIAVDVDRLGIHGCTSHSLTVKRKTLLAIHRIASSVIALPFLASGAADDLFAHDPFSRAICLIRKSSEGIVEQSEIFDRGLKEFFDILVERANFVGNFRGLHLALYSQPIPEVVGYGEAHTETSYVVKGKFNDGDEDMPSRKRKRTATDGGVDESSSTDVNVFDLCFTSYLAHHSTPNTDPDALDVGPYAPPSSMENENHSLPGHLASSARRGAPGATPLCFSNQGQHVLEKVASEQGSSFALHATNNGNIRGNLLENLLGNFVGDMDFLGHAHSSNKSPKSSAVKSPDCQHSEFSHYSTQSQPQVMVHTNASKMHSRQEGITGQRQPVQQTYQSYIDHGILGTPVALQRQTYWSYIKHGILGSSTRPQ